MAIVLIRLLATCFQVALAVTLYILTSPDLEAAWYEYKLQAPIVYIDEGLGGEGSWWPDPREVLREPRESCTL